MQNITVLVKSGIKLNLYLRMKCNTKQRRVQQGGTRWEKTGAELESKGSAGGKKNKNTNEES